LQVKAFTQNTRDEVRYIGEKGEGDHTGALAAQPGMKQTNYLHQDQTVRRLTPTECERLQGFPDGWTIP
jgi:DNA (cytosine-5)-methyltransferase 1